ncbi:MAG: hypothetical protein JWQ27_2191 [Ferruginibacter sp.]|nr:hypothetical protein [Ferruginibacter sp.]
MRQFLLLLLCSFVYCFSYGQDFSNKGKDFWVAYGYHQQMTTANPPGGTQEMVLYFATDQVTTVTVTIPGLGYNVTYPNIPANTVFASNIIPKTSPQDARLFTGSTAGENKGIHVVADKPIVAYAHIYNGSISGASILYPTNTLGKEYYSVNYTNNSNTANSNCWFYVVAADPGTTTVEITPSANTTTGWLANNTYTINLTQGQVYNVMGTVSGNNGVDLTGSRIKSIASGTGSCKRIAVFSGSGRIAISCTGTAPSSDNYMTQSLPKTAWGKKFLTLASAGYAAGAAVFPLTRNIYRVCVSDPTTVVKLNGLPIGLPLIGGFYYEIPATINNQLIEADKPVMVAQYFPSQSACNAASGDGDPEVIYLSPVEQSINTVRWLACRNSSINANKHYINIVVPNTGTAISSFRLDGNPIPASSFTAFTQAPGYSWAILNVAGSNVAPGIAHVVKSDSGFNAIAYGYGAAESYGYNAGTNVKDLYQQISVFSQYGIETIPSVCTGSPFKFKVSLPYQPDSMYWDFHGFQAPNVMVNTPAPLTYDSVRVVNGKTVWWYSLPTFYMYNTVGTFPVSITTYAANSEGCGTQQDIDFDLEVSNPPIADFTIIPGVCVADSAQFNDISVTTKPTYHWYWDFGDPASGTNNISNLHNPKHLFSAPGTYTVRFASITTPGCLSDTISRTVTIAPLPSATIGTTASVCVNGTPPTITFTGAGGTGGYTFSYKINGGATQTVSTVGTATTATITAPTTTAGTYTYQLVSVNNTGSTLCTQAQTSSAVITVLPLPTATVTGNTIVCQDAASPNIVFTGAAGTAPYTFTYTINGGANQTVTTVSGNTVTVPVPTTTAGTFTYALVAVSDGSANLCSQNQTGSAIVTVRPMPTATISGNTTVCQNAASPNITFTGQNGIAPYTFTYQVNGGANQTITTSTGNSVSLAVPTGTAGTFTYSLVAINDGSTNPCTQVQTGTAVVTVNPLPTATASGTTSVCLNAPSPVITFTGAGTTAPYTFSYTINGGPVQQITSTGNIATINAPTTTAGTFTYSIVSVTDGSSTLCSRNINSTAVITVNSLPTATILGTTTVCQNGTAPTITFTGAGATALPYTFTYTINGGANQTVTTVSGNSVTVTAPTATVGTFTYALVSVKDGSSTLCSQAQAGSAMITVHDLPTATIAGTGEVCLNAPSPQITFTGNGGTAPYTFTYSINGGPTQTVVTTTGNSVTVAVPTTTAGAYTYALVSVKESSSNQCAQAQTGNAVLTVNPLPTVAFTASLPSCATRTINFTDGSSPNAGTITTWQWSFGDPGSIPNNSSTLQSPSHVFSAAGTYNVNLLVTTDKGCANNATQPVVINKLPVAGFILPEVCLLDPFAQFTDTSKIDAPGSITAWKWNFGDPASGANNTSTVQNATHTYPAVGTYNVQLIAFSNSGCTDTLTQQLTVNGGNPQANFVAVNGAGLCANDSVRIQNKSTIGTGVITKVEIYWDNAGQPAVFDLDDFPAFNKIYAHKYPDFQSPLTRTFSVRFRAYSGGVCVNDRIQNITVNASPKVQFTAIPNACLNVAPYQVTQATETGGVPGSFVFSGPGISPGGIFDPIAVGPGTYTIKYTYTSNFGCVDSASQPITVLPAPVADFSFSAPTCEKTAVTFSSRSSASAGTLTTYSWNFGEGGPDEIRNSPADFTHTFATAGSFTVRLIVTTSDGCRSLAKQTIVTVAPQPKANFTFSTSVCLPAANVQFTDASTIANNTQNTFTYNWDFGEPSSLLLNNSTAKNPVHRYSSVGPFNVQLRVTSGAGCIHDTMIVVNSIHPQPKADFDFSKASICIGDNVTFRDLSTGGGGSLVAWNWNFGDQSTSALQNPTHLYSAANLYNVSLYATNSFGCNSDTLFKPFNVYPYPVVDAGPDRFVLEGGSVVLQSTVTGNDLQYLWLENRYLNNNRVAAPVTTPLQDITYRLTVTARGGCAAYDDVFVKVLLAPKIPNTFSPNSDGINDLWEIRYLDTYPGNRVQIFTRTGALVFESRGYRTPWDGTMGGKSLPVDTYYYIIEPGNGRKPITGYVTIIK